MLPGNSFVDFLIKTLSNDFQMPQPLCQDVEYEEIADLF